MSNQSQYQIVPMELGISILSFMLGVGILTLPGELANKMGTADGWISVLIAAFLMMIVVHLYTRLQRHYPGQNFLQFMARGSIGRWITPILTILFSIYFIWGLAYIARILSLIINMYVLFETPSEVVVFLIMLLTAYAVLMGLPAVIHLNMLFVPIILFVLTGIIALNLGNVSLNKLLPIMPEGIGAVLSGVPTSIPPTLALKLFFSLWLL